MGNEKPREAPPQAPPKPPKGFVHRAIVRTLQVGFGAAVVVGAYPAYQAYQFSQGETSIQTPFDEPLVQLPPDPIGLMCAADDGPCNVDTAFDVFPSKVSTKVEVPLEDINPTIVEVLKRTEDIRFDEHDGFDERGFLGALKANVLCLCIDRGGSTLDDQLAQRIYGAPTDRQLWETLLGESGKNIASVFPEGQRDEVTKFFWSKAAVTLNAELRAKYSPDIEANHPAVPPPAVAEGATVDPEVQANYESAVLQRQAAIDAEVQPLVKHDIMEMYLNNVDFGRGAIGIQAAAQAYFGVNASELTLRQGIVLIAGLPGPYSSDVHVSEAKKTPEIAALYESFILKHGIISTTAAEGEQSPFILDYGSISAEKLSQVLAETEEMADKMASDPGVAEEDRISAEDAQRIKDYGFFAKQHDYLTWRRDGVVNKLENQGVLSEADADQLRSETIVLAPYVPTTTTMKGNYETFQAQHLRTQALQEMEELGFSQDRVATEGLIVNLTFRPDYQQVANSVIAGETSLINSQTDEISLVSMLHSGAVLIYRCGKDEAAYQLDLCESDFNSGSTIKPFIIEEAFEAGWKRDTLVQVQKPDGSLLPVPLEPENDAEGITVDEGQHCAVQGNPPSCTPDQILAGSDNIGTAQAVVQAGGLAPTFDLINKAAGHEVVRKDWGPYSFYGTELSNVDQVTIGNTLFVNKGRAVYEPYFIESVTRPDGTVLYQHPDAPGGAVIDDPGNAQAIVDAMKGVFRTGGTADGVFTAPNGPDSVALKTGTDGSTDGVAESTRLSVNGSWCQDGIGAMTMSIIVGEPDNNSTPITAYDSSADVAEVWGKIVGQLQDGRVQCDIGAFAMQ